jgi:hypothetical protein
MKLLKLGHIKEKGKRLPVKYDKLSPMEKAEIRNLYIERQEGKCYYCNCLLSKRPGKKARERKLPEEFVLPPNFFDNPIHLHHNHVTGFTIGAVHALCNAVLYWYYGE